MPHKTSCIKKRFELKEITGANLVKNRKSLNQEAVRKNEGKIRCENLRFLEKLQQLKPSINTSKLIQEHRDRELLVKRISTFPLSISHNSTALTHQLLPDSNMPYSEFDTSTSVGGSKNTLIHRQDFFQRQKIPETQPKLFD